jgi:hypothetical protein
MFISSLGIYSYQLRELQLDALEKSMCIVQDIAEHFKVDLTAIKQCMIH